MTKEGLFSSLIYSFSMLCWQSSKGSYHGFDSLFYDSVKDYFPLLLNQHLCTLVLVVVVILLVDVGACLESPHAILYEGL